MKRFKQKTWTSLLLAVMMVVYLTAPGFTSIAQAANQPKTFDLVEITDFHGTLIDTYKNQVGAVLANRVKAVKEANPDRTLIIGGGDLYQGSAISNMESGVPVQQVMSNMGMEVTALGNHEFDWGLDTITNTTMKGASYSIVCANLYNKNADGSNGTRVFDPYKIITKDGVRIALIGAITSETPKIVLPANLKNFTFTDAATEINSVAKEIKDGKKADVIIAVIHAGNIYDSSYNDTGKGEIYDIANQLTGVNAVLGGHSHSIVHAKAANGLPIYIANCNGKGYVDVKMSVAADGTVTFPTPSESDYVALDNANGYKSATPVVDNECKDIIDAAAKKVAPITDEVIGKTTAKLDKIQVINGNGTGTYGESYLGDWAADVVRLKTNSDVGIANNGGIRADVPAGNITVGTLWQVMPFDNTIYVVPMKRAQLKSILEQAVMDGGKGIQISGIKFSYDANRPNLNRVVSITRDNGEAISDSETIKVAAPDYVATGGDLFTNFLTGGKSNPANDTHIIIRDAMIENIKANKDKVPSIITTMNQRITTVKAAQQISVVATSDVHGNVLNYDYASEKAPITPQGLAKVSTYVNGLRTANPGNVMLVDNGDTIQGTPLVYYYNMLDTTKLYPMMAVMGAMKYDAWTLGNHEFNYGLPTLNRVIKDAKNQGIKVLSANTYNKESGSNFVDSYMIKSFNIAGQSKKVAIIGLTTKNIPGWEDPTHYKGLQFNDLVTEAQKWVKEVKTQGADYVIVSAHSGEESVSDTTEENEIKAIATKVSGIDAIIAGHVHNVVNDAFVNPDGKNVLVTEPGKYATNVSQIDFGFNTDGTLAYVTTMAVPMTNSIADDPAILSTIKPYQDKTVEYVQTVIGKSTDEFKGSGQYVVATPIMDLINKVQTESAGTQLSIAAPLSSSAYIPKGDVTIKDVMSVYIYENFLFGVKMTGKQVKDWMEYSVRYYKQTNDPNLKIDNTTDYKTLKDLNLNIADYNLDMLYGATYDVDLTQPACTVDSNTGLVAGGNRIKNLKINGKLIKDTDVFTVAINNYRFNGGGGFTKAAGLTIKDANGFSIVNPALVTYDSAKALGDDGQVRSLMMSYIQKHKTITPDCTNNWKLYTTSVTQEVEPAQPEQPTDTVVVGDSKTILTPSQDIQTKIASKLVSVTGKTQNIFSFTTSSDVKPDTMMKIFVGKDWAGKTVTLCSYNKDKNIYEVVQTSVVVDKDGYITVKVQPSTTYFVTDAQNLPKTGSAVDMGVLVDLGITLTGFGALLFVIEERKRKENAA